ncbi:hypothetical protein ACQJBY_026652 [Aegilops geniculata]
MTRHTVCKRTSSNHIHGKPITNARSNIKLEDLPQDVLCTIVSKLPPKEVSRASVLSSNWRYICATCCYKLCFTVPAGYPHRILERKEYCQRMQEFINNVNAVVRNCHGKLVEEFNIKLQFDSMFVDHLNDWVNFAVSAQIRKIPFYLDPNNLGLWDPDHYEFPFHLCDSESISRLECIQLSFVSLRPPSEFSGFPSLRKLDLEFVDITRTDLEVILSNCCYLKWLSLVRCYLNDELKLDRPLSNLRHLAVVWCDITRIELPILKLDTFVYHGHIVPIVINRDSMLENAQLCLFKANFDDAVSAVLNGIPRVQNLTLQILKLGIEMQSLLNSTCMFSHLRCLQLLLGITLVDINKLPRVVSILRAAPSIEKLEIHFSGGSHLCEGDKGTVYKPQYLEHCEYNYLKSVHMTGYEGARGQLEFLVHVVEKAPALEALTVDTALELHDDDYVRIFCRKNACSARSALRARSCLGAILSPNVKLCVR